MAVVRACGDYTYMYQEVSEISQPLYSAVVEWETIRAHYERLFLEAKNAGRATQETVAERGGVDQPDISRLMSSTRLGPRVETFIRAIEGLGMSPAEFFAQIEKRHSSGKSGSPTESPPTPEAADDRAVSPLTQDEQDVMLAASTDIARAVYTGFERVWAARGSHRDTAQRTAVRRRGAPKTHRRSSGKN